MDDNVMENEDENEEYAETMKENIDWGCPVSFKDNFLVDVVHDGYERIEKSRQVLKIIGKIFMK